jgi:hypothetical protein
MMQALKEVVSLPEPPPDSQVSRSSLVSLAATLAVFVLSCSDGTAPTPVPCADDQQVTVSVSPGLQPTFSWEPACGMSSVQVWAVSPGSGGGGWVLYGGENAARNPLGSGIRYGRAPSGAIEPAPEVPLVAGQEYMVAVYRWIGEPGGPGGLFDRGGASFRP